MPNPREFLKSQEYLEPGSVSHHDKEQSGAARLIQGLWRRKHDKQVEDKRDWILLPILIIPGIASSGLVIEESGLPHPEKYAGNRVWMNVAFLAAERMKTGTINEDEIASLRESINDLDTGDFEKAESAFQIRSAWLHHMSLAPNMVEERPGNRVRVYNGLEGIEYLSDDAMTQVGSWVHAPVTKYLVEQMGYEKGKNLDGAPYDWRLPPAVTETRDGYLTKTMQRVEQMFERNNGLPVVLICHSMGCKMGHYFLNFCLQEKGQAWIDKYIHTYMPVGAPHGGVSLAVRSGVTGKGLNDQVDMLLEGDDEGLVLYRSWGSGAWLMPRHLPPRVVPSCIVRREGEVGLKIASALHVGPLFKNRHKPPKELRLTVIFRGTIRAHTQFVPVVVLPTEKGEPLQATITFEETFYMAVPYLGDYDHLGELKFFLEEPAGRLHQNPSEFRQKMRSYTSWGPLREFKKAASHKIREICKKWGTVLRVAVCANPWKLQASQFQVTETGEAPAFLEAEIPMCGCEGNDDTNHPLGTVGRTVAYNDNMPEGDEFDPTSVLRGGMYKVTEKDTKPRLDQHLGTLHVKVCYTPPPSPVPKLAETTPVATTIPRKTPKIPIRCKDSKNNNSHEKPVFDTMNGHDLLYHDGFCSPIWDLLQKYYEGDPLGPTTKSAYDAPPVKRIRSIYGINLPTEVCAVYRHRPVVVIGDDMADSRYVLDTSATFPADSDNLVQNNTWARHNLHDYKMVNGRILETPQTLQDVPGKMEQKRVCGDGTVPYWNLVHCLNWRDEVPDLVVDELKGAEHRGILADGRFHSLLKRYCKVRDPRASAMLHLRQQHKSNVRMMKRPGAGGIGTLKDALNDD